MSVHSQLAAVIRSEMGTPIPFRRFMELALYHPEHGYYTSGRARVGRKGDFFTNVSIGSLYGRLMARQFAEIWHRLGQPSEFSIIEQGAHNGDFAGDTLKELRTLDSGCFAATHYRIVEPAAALQAKQREKLAEHPQHVEWFTSQTELPRWTGVHFSDRKSVV